MTSSPQQSTGGHREWFVSDGYIPPKTTGAEPSHESMCLLNTGSADASVVFTAYFADEDPRVSSPVVVAAGRSLHARTDAIEGLRLEKGVPYALVARSDVPLYAQYSRLDTTQAAYSLMSITPIGEN